MKTGQDRKPDPARGADLLTSPTAESKSDARVLLKKFFENRPKALHQAVLALIDDDDTVLFQVLDKEEVAAVKAQFRGANRLSAAEEETLHAGGVGGAALKMAPALWALARKASADKYEALVNASLTVEQAAARLKVTPSRVRQLLGSSRLYGLKVAGLDWRIPSFQFLGRGGLIPGIEKVTMRIVPRRVPLLAFYNWLTTPNPDLRTRDEEEALSPLDWLQIGESPEEAAALSDAL